MSNLASLRGRIRTYFNNQRDIAALNRLSNRELDDLGLSRGDIARRVRFGN